MSTSTARRPAAERRPAPDDEQFRDLMAVASMVQYCKEEAVTASPLAGILLANAEQVLIAEIKQRLAAALGRAAA
jgi:hypothetical protein